MLCILTIPSDFHAIAIAAEYEKISGERSIYFDVSKTGSGGDVAIEFRDGHSSAQLTDAFGEAFSPEDLSSVWFRRVKIPDHFDNLALDEEQSFVLGHEFYCAWEGAFQSHFSGTWISNPAFTRKINNKVYQLHIARKVGFKVPNTLISDDPQKICEFQQENRGEIIAKPQYGMSEKYISVEKIVFSKSDFEESPKFCSIYQSYVPGNIHLRANVFGETCLVYEIKSESTDWRFSLRNCQVRQIDCDLDFEKKLVAYLKYSGLKMGIFDFKVNNDGEPVFFEVNSQGQFLFLEPYTSRTSILRTFVNFLIQSGQKSQ